MLRVTSALVLAVFLSACGGGGAGPAPSVEPVTPPPAAPPPVAPPAPPPAPVLPTTVFNLTQNKMETRIGGHPVLLTIWTPGELASAKWAIAPGQPGQLIPHESELTGDMYVKYMPPTTGLPGTSVTVSATVGDRTEQVSILLRPPVDVTLLAQLGGFGQAKRLARTASGQVLVSGRSGGVLAISPAGAMRPFSGDKAQYQGLAIDDKGQLLTARANFMYSQLLNLGIDGIERPLTELILGNPQPMSVNVGSYNDGANGAPGVGIGMVDGMVSLPGGKLAFVDLGRIRTWTPDGTIATLAGHCESLQSNKFGLFCMLGKIVDGKGGAARFYNPQAIAVDAAGMLYVADTTAVRKVAPDGTVSTLASGSAQANYMGIARAANGDIYLANYASNSIEKLDASGKFTTIAWSVGELDAPIDVIVEDARTLLVLTYRSVYRLVLP